MDSSEDVTEKLRVTNSTIKTIPLERSGKLPRLLLEWEKRCRVTDLLVVACFCKSLFCGKRSDTFLWYHSKTFFHFIRICCHLRSFFHTMSVLLIYRFRNSSILETTLLQIPPSMISHSSSVSSLASKCDSPEYWCTQRVQKNVSTRIVSSRTTSTWSS